MAERIDVEESVQKEIVRLYTEEYISVNAMSRKLNISRHLIYKVLKDNNISRKRSKNFGGQKVIWTSDMETTLIDGYNSPNITVLDLAKKLGLAESTVTIKAKSMGLVKRYKRSLTTEDIEAIQSMGETKTLSEIAEYLCVNIETLRKTITDCHINYTPKRGKIKVPLTEEFFTDIRNPKYTGLDLAKKYNVVRETILNWRRKLYGKFTPQLDTTSRLNELELYVSSILDDFDIVYTTHKKLLNKWTVDFYLGNKHLIEVNGTVWHNNPKNKEKDERKLKDLKEEGYHVLVINVNHKFKKADTKKIKRMIKEFWVPPTRDSVDKELRERKKKRCVKKKKKTS